MPGTPLSPRPVRRTRVTKRAVAIRHVAFEDLGIFAGPIESAGFRIDYLDAGVDDLQAAAGADLLFVLGGPISANDEARYAFLAAERALLSQRIAADRPTLGICLGAQLIARAAGAIVRSNATPEIGVAPLALTAAGSAGPLAAYAGQPAAMHWHGEACDLPSGATLLASSAHCANQAFKLGGNVIAFQFHPEIAQAAFERWLIGHAVELAARGCRVAALRRQMARCGDELERKGRATIDAWLDQVAPQRRRAAAPPPVHAEGPRVQHMLTRNGLTLPDALGRYRALAAQAPPGALPYVGFSNVGLPAAQLEELGYAIVDDGRKVVVEIVRGTSAADEIAAAELAKRVGAACLIGGHNVEAVLATIARSPLRYFPALGAAPGASNGPDAIAAEAAHYQMLGVDGVMVIPDGGAGDIAAMLSAVRTATPLDIILAGPEGAWPGVETHAPAGIWACTRPLGADTRPGPDPSLHESRDARQPPP